MLPIFAIPVLSLALVAWAVGQPPPRQRASARVDGRGHPARVRSVDARADRRHHRRRRSGSPLAVDADSRGAAPGPGRRRAGGPVTRSRRRGMPVERLTDPAGVEPSAPAPPPAAAPAPRRPGAGSRCRRARRTACGARRPPPRAPTGPAFADPARDGIVRGVRIDDRLVPDAAGRAVAPADRTGLVVLRGRRRPPLHPGAARRRRDRLLLPADHRRAGVETPRRGPVLGVEWRRRSARDADPQRRSRLHAGRDRNPERARRRATAPSCGRATRRPTPARRSRAGASRARRWWSTTSSSSPPPAGSPPTMPPPASPRWLGPPEGGGYSSPHSVTIDGVAAGPAAARTPARPASRRPTARCSGSTRGSRASASCSRP